VSKAEKPAKPARNPRDFLAALAEWDPDSVLRVKEPIALDYDMTAMAMELERRGQSPVLWFEKVGDSPFAVISNVFGNRKRYAFALGVEETELFDAWGRLGDKLYPLYETLNQFV
jgi:UbiD family decarboxylase